LKAEGNKMANQEHLEILKKGVKDWNKWRKENPRISPDLRNAELRGCHLKQGNLRKVNLIQADLSFADLRSADLSKADLSFAILRSADLREADLSFVNLSSANLSRADLREADLSLADLINVDLKRADLCGAELPLTNLSQANLTQAKLRGANINATKLNKANLIQADLTAAILSGAELKEADMKAVTLLETVFGDLNLNDVKNIELCNHQGPSIIDHRTLMKSGELPMTFLRGCGLPDTFIENYPSLFLEKVNQFYSCFINYSLKDEEVAQKIHADLQNNGIRCWFAPKEGKMGERIRSRIDQGIKACDKLLLIFSKNSIKSNWIENEVEKALEKESKSPQNTVLFPIRLDDSIMETDEAWAATIRRTRSIGDFTNWKDHGFYKKSFDKLMCDLKV
jgi:uncharacterized protein YjbI with pentapeptide repeats